jgi:hypothetical protein
LAKFIDQHAKKVSNPKQVTVHQFCPSANGDLIQNMPTRKLLKDVYFTAKMIYNIGLSSKFWTRKMFLPMDRLIFTKFLGEKSNHAINHH